MPRFISRLIALGGLILILFALPAAALAQDSIAGPFRDKLAANTKVLDEISATLAGVKGSDEAAQQALQGLRSRIDHTQADLVSLLASVTPIRDASKERLEKLQETAPDKDVVDARAEEKALNAKLNAIVSDAQIQAARVKDLSTALMQRQQAAPAAALTRDTSAADFQNRLNDATSVLDQINASLTSIDIKEDGAQQVLQKLRLSLEETRTALITLQTDLTSARDASKKRRDALGEPPKPGDPPEAADVKATRDKETALSKALDDVAKNLQYQLTRATEQANTATELQREAIAGRLFRGGDGAFSVKFWAGVGSSLPGAINSANYVVNTSLIYFRSQVNSTSIAIFFLTIAAGYIVTRLVRVRINRWRGLLANGRKTSRRYVASLDAVLGIVSAMLGLPAAVGIGVLAFSFSKLLPIYVIEDFGWDFIQASLVSVGLWALLRAILSVENAELRLISLSDWAVRRISRRLTLFSIVLGLSILLDGFIRSLHADPSLTIARDGISALFYLIIIASLLIRIRSAPPTVVDGRALSIDEDISRLDILRPISWVAVAVMAVSLVLGYMTLAVAAAVLPLMVICIIVASYLLITLIDSALTDNLLNDHDRRRAIASAIGVTTKNVAFSATLLSGVLRLFIVFFALIAMGAPFGFYSTDMLPVLQRAYFGFQVGEMTISPSSILIGIALFIAFLAVTRLVRNWVHNTLLPRTTLDAGLQNSIATIIGYIGMVFAVMAFLSELGIGFQNVSTIIAALGIGIGLGLQPIVTNFVSGLILLAERPIRVGDIVAASGEEGYVRRISVRATQIETFDRATVIVPNSMLINSAVKNWVYGNTWSRLRITLALGYDCDVETVKAAMLGAAEDDPRILPTPPPRVLLSQMGNTALEFELTVMVASMETVAAVKSDMLLRILSTFRAKGIRVVAQLPAAPAPVVVSLDEALSAVGAARVQNAKPVACEEAASKEAAPKTGGRSV